MWLARVSALAAFEILPPIKDGKLVPPPGAYLEGSTGCVNLPLYLALPSAIRILPLLQPFPLQAFHRIQY
jgi:hypothetical protein